jgi:CRISPR/Cas system-associated exonuclease Cas4 (RecB family)
VNYAAEHKTSAYNLNTAWEAQMEMTPQITGYLLGLEAITGQPATHCIAVGMKIPLPRIAENGINAYFTERFDHERSEWLRWVYTNARIVEQYRHDPVKAEARYHSCNAYFRPCALIEWCSNAEAEREDMLEDMLDVPWHPFRRAQVQK